MNLVAPSNEVVPPVAAAPPADLPVSEDVARAKKSPKSANDANAKDTKVASNAPNEGAFTGLQFGNGKSPIDIKSDSMSLDYQNHSVLWTGHVRANQANAQLTSDDLRVNYLDKDFKNMKDMVADGNVRISQGTRWATGDHGVMDQIKRTVVLTGSPVVHDGTRSNHRQANHGVSRTPARASSKARTRCCFRIRHRKRRARPRPARRTSNRLTVLRWHWK